MVDGTIFGTVATHAACPVLAVSGRPAWPDAPVVGVTEPETALQAIGFGFDTADLWGVPLLLRQVGNDLRQHRLVCDAIVRLARGRVPCAQRYPDVPIGS